jgi:molecular chaperone GrpE
MDGDRQRPGELSGPASDPVTAANAAPDSDGANTEASDAALRRRSEATPALRARLLRRFEAWLDAALDDEEPPAGLTAEILTELAEDGPIAGPCRNVDLYTLWSSLTALSQEIKLQGRSFKQLLDSLSPWSERAEQVLQAHAEGLATVHRLAQRVGAEGEARQAEAARQIRQRVRREQLEQLVDLRERLLRGVETARGHRAAARELLDRGLIGRIRRGRAASKKLLEAIEAIENGCALSLARLDEALDRSAVQEMACRGRPFDPARMKAVDLLETSEVPEGTVLEVYRRGYESNGEVFREAEVKVARAPRGPLAENRHEP